MEDNIMTLEEFVFNIPLYQVINEKNGYNDIVGQLKTGSRDTAVDGYNPIRKKDSTFCLEKGLGDLRQRQLGGVSYYLSYYSDILAEVGVKTLVFKCQRYYDKITIAVFHNPDDSLLIKVGQFPSVADIHIGQVKQYDKVLEKLPDTGTNILLVHEPDFAQESSQTDRFDLQISGHSHGGQFIIPKFETTPFRGPNSTKYPVGLYKIGNMTQYTSKGLGTNSFRIRINCKPEITIITLKTKNRQKIEIE